MPSVPLAASTTLKPVSYTHLIYFGKHPVWKYVNAAAQTLLSPLDKIPLRLGKADFAPVLGIALIFFLAEAAGRGLTLLYGKLSP